jgi:hypothetical protein
MRYLVLRWTLWISLLTTAGLAGLGFLRFFEPPAERVPLDGFYKRVPQVVQDEATVAPFAPEEEALSAGFAALWPTSLPPEFVLQDTDTWRGRLSVLWVVANPEDRSPLLQLDQQLGARELPDRTETTVRGLPGRVGPTTCGYREVVSRAPSQRDCQGVWWIEDGLSVALTSPTLSSGELLTIADSLRPLNVTQPVPVSRRHVVRIGPRQVSAGQVTDFPVPSVTYLANLNVFLVRTSAGFTALVDEDLHLLHRTAWNTEWQRFISPSHGEMYTWLGRCMQGPCPRGLDRFAVSTNGNIVAIDISVRLMQPLESRWFRSAINKAPVWP